MEDDDGSGHKIEGEEDGYISVPDSHTLSPRYVGVFAFNTCVGLSLISLNVRLNLL